MNRGLIEAAKLGVEDNELNQLPRFMNRGLIEALAELSTAKRSTATSPIHESGPH